jgi:class 3 adenylate cyclase
VPELSSIDVVADAAQAEGFDFAGVSSPDGALTLLLMNIENLGELEQSLGAGRSHALVEDYAGLVRKLVETHFGNVVKSEGDGFMCSFASAHSGVRCAIEIQRTFSGGDALVRVGLHSGFVIENPDAFMGRNVVLAARIANHAKGGEILVSSSTHEYTATDASLEFEPRGEVHFKGMLGEHALYAVRH